VINLPHLEDIATIIRRRKKQLHTFETLTGDEGKSIHIEMVVLPIERKYGLQGGIVFLHNITDRVQYENRLKKSLSKVKNQYIQLKELKRRAESANRAKDVFLSNMSHELRTPLNGIVGALTLLDIDSLKPSQKEYMQVLKHSADHLNRMVCEILDLTQMETGRFTLRPQQFPLGQFLSQVTSPFHKQAQRKGLNLFVNENYDPDETFSGDPLRLGQILYHLLSNAIKFTEKGEVNLTVECEKKEGAKSLLNMVVEDQGVGVDPVEARMIFTKFTQADSSKTKKFAGIGHGLYLTKKLVDLMKGKIRVEPSESGGAKFIAEIPEMHVEPDGNKSA